MRSLLPKDQVAIAAKHLNFLNDTAAASCWCLAGA